MKAALITYSDSSNENKTTEKISKFPIVPYWGDGAEPTTINDTDIELFDLISIDIAPEQEYHLTSDEDGHDYVIPIEQKSRFDYLLYHATEEEFNDNLFDKEFSMYMQGGDWRLNFKIVKK